MIPFSHVEHFAEGGIFYGENQITKSIITLDRTQEMNANGYILGCSGSGKSMFSKAEMFDVLLGDNLQARKEFIAEFGHKFLDLADIS